METLVVVTSEDDWPLDLDGARLVTAHRYLTDPEFSSLRHAKVFNLCRFYRYQAYGYYVSLLAEARGHKAIPTVLTMQDLRSPALVRMASDELEDVIKKTLGDGDTPPLELHLYFGRSPDPRFERLAASLFRQFTAPFLRAVFVRPQQWELHQVTAIPASAIPDEHRTFAFDSAQAFFRRNLPTTRPRRPSRFDLAILHDPQDPTCPSDPFAIQRFVSAAEAMGVDAEVIGREDGGRLLEFDALFIRATTAVNHYTYRFARRAAAEGLVVIDDPVSILRCTNKVYLAEVLARQGLPAPKTLIVHRDERERVAATIGFPCIVKQPDSSSSLGVFKADEPRALEAHLERLFGVSDLVVAQEFVPTEYDWRIGILDRRPLFAAKYFMARHHWQIIRHDATTERSRYGRWEVVPAEEVPKGGVELALKAANLMGDGLYGVDLKQVDGRWLVIEVNDNPNIEHGVEDLVLKDDLYRRVVATFVRRLEAMIERVGPR